MDNIEPGHFNASGTLYMILDTAGYAAISDICKKIEIKIMD